MKIDLIPGTFSLNDNYVQHYIESISIPYDDFLEDFILESDFFNIHIDGNRVGYFAVYQQTMLTQFFLETKHISFGITIFDIVLKDFGIKQAFVPTSDMLFLSLCLERFKKIEIQALHFEYTNDDVQPAEFSRSKFRIANLDDLEAIKSVTGDFLENHEKMIEEKSLYVLYENSELLGVGVFILNKIMPNCVGTGMFTNEKYRQQGVGRSIILHLADISLGKGLTPVPGCWYYNVNSRKTLESAGYITRSKLLKIHL